MLEGVLSPYKGLFTRLIDHRFGVYFCILNLGLQKTMDINKTIARNSMVRNKPKFSYHFLPLVACTINIVTLVNYKVQEV